MLIGKNKSTLLEDTESRSLRGALSKYKNETLQDEESKDWSKAVVENMKIS